MEAYKRSLAGADVVPEHRARDHLSSQKPHYEMNAARLLRFIYIKPQQESQIESHAKAIPRFPELSRKLAWRF